MAPARPGVRSHYRQPGPCLMLHYENPLRDAPPTLTPLRPALARSGSASRDSSSRRARDPVKHWKRRQSLENNPRWAGSPGGPRRPTLAFSQEGAPAAPRFFGPGRMPRPEVRRGTHQAEGASGTGSDSWLPGGGERRAGSGLTLPLRGFPGSLREGDGGQGGCQRPVTAVSRDPRNIKNEELAKQAHTNYRAVGFKRFH